MILLIIFNFSNSHVLTKRHCSFVLLFMKCQENNLFWEEINMVMRNILSAMILNACDKVKNINLFKVLWKQIFKKSGAVIW